MLKPFNGLRGTAHSIRAAPYDIFLARFLIQIAHSFCAANWALLGQSENIPSAIFHHAEHLRNDIACPLYLHRVARFNAEALNFVFIMKRGIGHNDPANGDGREARNRRQRARAADLNINRFEHSCRFFGGKFMRNRPARRARYKAKTVL